MAVSLLATLEILFVLEWTIVVAVSHQYSTLRQVTSACAPVLHQSNIILPNIRDSTSVNHSPRVSGAERKRRVTTNRAGLTIGRLRSKGHECVT